MKEQTKTDLLVLCGVIALIVAPILAFMFAWVLLALFAAGAVALVGLGAFIYLRMAWDRSKARRDLDLK